MKERFVFNKDFRPEESFSYVMSPASKSRKCFVQREDCIENTYNEEIQDFDYISMITKKRYPIGTTVKVTCSFEKFGAPLIVITDDCHHVSEKGYIYGLHFEIVAYENGCNVWHIVPGKGKEPIEVTKVNSMEFLVEEKSKIHLEVKILKGELQIRLNDHTMTAKHHQLPEMMQIGITACEGINQFYDLEIW